MKCPVRPGVRGWLITGLTVLAVDLLCETTLSESFRDFSRTRHGRFITMAGWAVLTAHLFGAIPVERDPIVLAFARLPKRRKAVVISV